MANKPKDEETYDGLTREQLIHLMVYDELPFDPNADTSKMCPKHRLEHEQRLRALRSRTPNLPS